MKLLSCRSAMTSGYHPQPDAAETVNRLALKVLRSLIPALADRWDEVLDLIEFALNNATCSMHPNPMTKNRETIQNQK